MTNGIVLNKIVCEYCRREIEEPLDNEIDTKRQELQELNELIKDMEKLPTVHNIIHRFKSVGLTYDDLILLIQAKTKLNRGDIRKILDVLKGYNRLDT